jgi:hypothetical protein
MASLASCGLAERAVGFPTRLAPGRPQSPRDWLMFLTRSLIEHNPEMLQHLLPAADERFGDAAAALISGSPTGCVYLAGYVVEMVLKHAALRTEGLRPNEPVQPALAPARARVRLWLGDVAHESYHSIQFWALALRETWRHRRGEVPKLIAEATRRAMHLHGGWIVAVRYRSNLVQQLDAKEFLARAGWYRACALDLWR